MSGKRSGGRLVKVDGKQVWLVLTESTRENDDSDWIHECGEIIMASTVHLSHRVPIHFGGAFALAGSGEVQTVTAPYCPKCESAATHGVFYDSGERHIHT